MPKIAQVLSAAAVAKLRAPGRYAVGGVAGLHLRVTPTARLWVLRVMVEAGDPETCEKNVDAVLEVMKKKGLLLGIK